MAAVSSARRGESGSGVGVFRALAGLIGSAAVVALLAWAVGTPASCVSALLAPSALGFDVLLPAVAGVFAWCAVIWFATLIVVEIAATTPGVAGRACARVADQLAPRVLRTAARWVLGATLVATPMCTVVSGTALAAATGNNAAPNLDRPVASAIASSAGIDLDRPFAPRAPATLTAASTPPAAPTRSAPSRTSAPYVAPAPPPATKVAVPNGAPLLTGAPHREADHEGGYVVRHGDALWDVAARQLGPNATAADIAREWPRWYAANRAVIGADPNLLRPGEVLHAPSA
jgi:hypothetical protein